MTHANFPPIRPSMEIQHGYAKVNGIRLHYAETGSGDDLVILLHGFPEFWYSWRHQLTALGPRFPCRCSGYAGLQPERKAFAG